ncbi:MAG TPA: DinB family protein [Candidatus Limnocylindrales bacterium]
MSDPTIRAAYSMWPQYNRRLRDVVAAMTDDQLAIRQPNRITANHDAGEAWPIWATVGHTACQRVFWLCDFAGEPGAETTRFTDAGNNCPGDDDLEHPLGSAELVEALDASFRIVEGCLDRWTLEMLGETLRRPEWDASWVHTRGSVLQRVFSHDIYHCGELSQSLGIAGLPQIDLWDTREEQR